MSRHNVSLDGRALAIGWDHPMLSFFAMDDKDEEDGWSIGMGFREFYDLNEFKDALGKEGIRLPLNLEGKLYADRDLGTMD